MRPGAKYYVTTFCNQRRPLLVLVCLSDSAPATAYGQRIANGAAVVHAAGNMRALPFAGEARLGDAGAFSPSTPLPKNHAKAPMQRLCRGSFRAVERPRGGVPRLSAANKKEKLRVKKESFAALVLWFRPEGVRHVH